jgi:Transcriptional regulators
MSKPRKRVTIRDVAKIAGVSPATVSLVLGGDPRVNEKTRKHVLDTVERLQYTPNEIGRIMRSQRIGAIAFIIPNTSSHVFSHPYFSQLLEGMTEVMNRYNYNLLISTTPNEKDEAVAYDKILRNRRADGIILSSASIHDDNLLRAADSGYPVVYLGKWFHPDVLTVERDDFGGAYQATEHLIKLGRRRIVHVSGPLDHQESLDRLEGYKQALADHKILFENEWLVEKDFSRESGYRAGMELVDAGIAFDAVFAGNDLMAIGLLKAFKERGIAVPRDVSLVGFDDIEMASVVSPQLTTVRQPMKLIGALAAEKLMNVLHGEPPGERRTKVTTELIIRESCGSGAN